MEKFEHIIKKLEARYGPNFHLVTVAKEFEELLKED